MTRAPITVTAGAGDTPTVVFIAQLGTPGASWRPVIDAMTSGAPTVTYDRPGIGACPPRPAPNPPLPYSAFAAELETLLREHGVAGPLIVVGHSVGCLIARMFVHRNPDRIAGIIHVDASIPRLSLWPVATHQAPPDGDHPGATSFDILAGEAEIITAAIPDVPTLVIARTPGRWSPGYHRCDALWSAYQRQLATLHHAPLLVAADADHQIPARAPVLVARSVDHVVGCASPT